MDETWEITIKVKVTTMGGWEPDRNDIDAWLANGGTLELVSIEKTEISK